MNNRSTGQSTDPIQKSDSSCSETSRFPSGFHPPLQVIADALTLAGIDYLISDTADDLRLSGIRIFSREAITDNTKPVSAHMSPRSRNQDSAMQDDTSASATKYVYL